MRSKTRVCILGALAVAALGAGGCKKKLTYERWESLRVGEPKAAVKSTLGKPLDERGARLIYTDPDQGIATELWFDPRTGALTYSQWADPVHGTHAKGTRPGE